MKSADCIVDLSPPTSDQAVSPDLSPSDYIHHPAMLSVIRQETSLDIGPDTHRRCYLQPPAIDTDRTIVQYYNRISESVYKANISVRIPGEEFFEMLCAGQDCEKTLDALDEDYLKEAYEKRMFEFNTEIITLRNRMALMDKARFKIFKANILVDFVKRVFVDLHLDYPGNLEEIKDTMKTRHTQAALSLNQRQLEVFFGEEGKKLGPQYYRVLQNITQYIGYRNETAQEGYIDFAVLLHSETYRERSDYWKWANLFPYVYGKRVDEIVNDLDAADKDELLGEEEWGPVGYAAGDKI